MRIEPIKPTRKNKPWFLQKFQFGGLPGFNVPASLANAFENTDFGDWSSIQSAATSVGGQNVADAFAQDNPDLITGNVMQSLAYSQGLSKAYEQNPIRTAEQIDADAEAAAKRRTFLGIGKKKAKRKAAEELQGMNDRRIANNENLAGAYAPIENSNMVTQYAGMANLMALLDGFQFQQGGPTNFEQRIQNPTLSLINKDGTKSSHKMMSFGIDGKHYAAPTIVEVNGALVELAPEEAINYAMRTGEYKEFKTERQARRYAENGYKKGTPMDMGRFQQGGRGSMPPPKVGFMRGMKLVPTGTENGQVVEYDLWKGRKLLGKYYVEPNGPAGQRIGYRPIGDSRNQAPMLVDDRDYPDDGIGAFSGFDKVGYFQPTKDKSYKFVPIKQQGGTTQQKGQSNLREAYDFGVKILREFTDRGISPEKVLTVDQAARDDDNPEDWGYEGLPEYKGVAPIGFYKIKDTDGYSFVPFFSKPLPPRAQQGGVAQLGYSINSPYQNLPAIDIPGNNITMANTNRPLMAYPNVGHPRLLSPFSGTHIFPGATSVREVPLKKKGGKPKKYYQAGGPGSGAVGAQLEDGEFFVTGNVDIMETAARDKHKNMKSDMVTDILGKEDYVFSVMDNRIITRKQAEAASFGYGGMLYEEGEKPDLPVETTAASIFKDGEKELSITDYVKRVRDKYKVRSMDEADIFTKKTNAANKEARIPFLMFASGMNESKRKGKNKSGWVSSYENMFEDSIMNSANLEKEDGEYGIHPNQGGDTPEFQGGGLAALSVLSPLLGIGLGIGQLGANKNNYRDTTKFLAQDRNDINSLAQTQSQFSGLSTAAQMAGILGQDPYVEAPQFDTTQLDATIRRTPRSVFDLQVARLSSASKPYMNQLFNNAGSFSEAVNAYSPVAASNASSMADIGMNQALQDINMENNYRLQKQGYADRQVLADVGARNATKDNANRLTNAFAGVASSGIEGQGQIESQRQNALRANNQAKLQSVMAWRQGKANAWKGILGNVGAGSQALYNTQLLKMYPPTNGVQTTTGVPDLGPYPEEQSMMPPPPLPWESPDMNSYLYAPMPYYPIDPNGVPTNNLPWATRPRG